MGEGVEFQWKRGGKGVRSVCVRQGVCAPRQPGSMPALPPARPSRSPATRGAGLRGGQAACARQSSLRKHTSPGAAPWLEHHVSPCRWLELRTAPPSHPPTLLLTTPADPPTHSLTCRCARRLSPPTQTSASAPARSAPPTPSPAAATAPPPPLQAPSPVCWAPHWRCSSSCCRGPPFCCSTP